ncbi:MAG: carbamoyltransferase HypF [Terriglobales bacterium]
MVVRKGIEVSGVVQGVGFRPHVYRLATERHLVGHIRNTPAGVDIEIQGESEAVEDFIAHLTSEAPPLSRITDLHLRDLPSNGDARFVIVESARGAAVQTLISPDVAVCDDCRRELLDPRDRRYRYPFINCTNCGPRFTIVRDIPYDRAHTSMARFTMCPDCQAEYDNPLDRRFHAQPNACWRCGPQLQLWDASGDQISCDDPIAEAAARLQTGEVVAVKGLGGFHLAVDATNSRAVELLRERKGRVDKPFAVMVPDLATAEQFCDVDTSARALLQQMQRPIVLLPRKPESLPEAVAPRNRDLGIFLPYTPLHHLLFAAGGFRALVMTSGNRSEEPIAIDNQEAVRRLRGIADSFLVHDRDILLRCDDAVVRSAGGAPRQMRRSRGYVPMPVFLHEALPPVLAVGGELKNTICLTKGRHAFLSQHIGDLENLESYNFFAEAVEHLQRILEIEPRVIAYDLHPNYFSTRWAQARDGVEKVGVQHHHAHVASCMAENGLDGKEKVIGFALDGTGYGTDGHIWGGEVLLADYVGFERAAHLAYVPMPGGEAAIREPWRMALSYLTRSGLKLGDLPSVSRVQAKKAELVLRMLEKNVNCPLTSSCGRLFDAVAALLGVRETVNYEAQAAIELEMLARDSADERPYSFALVEENKGANVDGNEAENQGWIIETEPLWQEILADLKQGVPASAISRRFHLGLVAVLAEVARRLRQRTAVDRVCLSGGSFNNLQLFERLQARLIEDGFLVFSHREVPAGDGGLSFGQALVAARRC